MNENNGIRFAWNCFHKANRILKETFVPLSVFIHTFKGSENMPVANYNPVVCAAQKCKAILNPYSVIDISSKTWSYRLCNHRNNLPTQYHAISQESIPLELKALPLLNMFMLVSKFLFTYFLICC